MRISGNETSLVLTDTPRGVWLLGALFVCSGAFVTTTPLWMPEWRTFGAWERLAVLAIGLAHLAGGLVTIRQLRATTTVLDRRGGIGTHATRRMWPWRAESRSTFALADARALHVVRSEDGDGDAVFRLRLQLASREAVWLQAQPVHGEARVASHADRISAYLELGQPTSVHEPRSKLATIAFETR